MKEQILLETKQYEEPLQMQNRKVRIGYASSPETVERMKKLLGKFPNSFMNVQQTKENVAQAVYMGKPLWRFTFVMLDSKQVLQEVSKGNLDIGIVSSEETFGDDPNVVGLWELSPEGEETYPGIVIMNAQAAQQNGQKTFASFFADELIQKDKGETI